MRKLIAGLVVGLTLGGAATAGATATEWWHRNHIGCTPNQGGVACKPDGTRNIVLIQRAKTIVGVAGRTVIVNGYTGRVIVGDGDEVVWTG